MTTQVWVIRSKSTGEHWQSSSGKASWCKSGHAKNAWSSKHTDLLHYYTDMELVDLVAEHNELKGYMANFIEEALPELTGSIVELGEKYLEALTEG